VPNFYAPRTMSSQPQHLERLQSSGTLNSTQTVNQMGNTDSTGQTYQLAQTPPDHNKVRNISLA